MALKDYWEKLPEASPKSDFKERVISECGISNSTFYNWMNGITDIPKTSRERIATIAGKQVSDLFPSN
jgi:ACT domain-containing protein